MNKKIVSTVIILILIFQFFISIFYMKNNILYNEKNNIYNSINEKSSSEIDLFDSTIGIVGTQTYYEYDYYIPNYWDKLSPQFDIVNSSILINRLKVYDTYNQTFEYNYSAEILEDESLYDGNIIIEDFNDNSDDFWGISANIYAKDETSVQHAVTGTYSTYSYRGIYNNIEIHTQGAYIDSDNFWGDNDEVDYNDTYNFETDGRYDTAAGMNTLSFFDYYIGDIDLVNNRYGNDRDKQGQIGSLGNWQNYIERVDVYYGLFAHGKGSTGALDRGRVFIWTTTGGDLDEELFNWAGTDVSYWQVGFITLYERQSGGTLWKRNGKDYIDWTNNGYMSIAVHSGYTTSPAIDKYVMYDYLYIKVTFANPVYDYQNMDFSSNLLLEDEWYIGAMTTQDDSNNFPNGSYEVKLFPTTYGDDKLMLSIDSHGINDFGFYEEINNITIIKDIPDVNYNGNYCQAILTNYRWSGTIQNIHSCIGVRYDTFGWVWSSYYSVTQWGRLELPITIDEDITHIGINLTETVASDNGNISVLIDYIRMVNETLRDVGCVSTPSTYSFAEANNYFEMHYDSGGWVGVHTELMNHTMFHYASSINISFLYNQEFTVVPEGDVIATIAYTRFYVDVYDINKIYQYTTYVSNPPSHSTILYFSYTNFFYYRIRFESSGGNLAGEYELSVNVNNITFFDTVQCGEINLRANNISISDSGLGKGKLLNTLMPKRSINFTTGIDWRTGKRIKVIADIEITGRFWMIDELTLIDEWTMGYIITNPVEGNLTNPEIYIFDIMTFQNVHLTCKNSYGVDVDWTEITTGVTFNSGDQELKVGTSGFNMVLEPDNKFTNNSILELKVITEEPIYRECENQYIYDWRGYYDVNINSNNSMYWNQINGNYSYYINRTYNEYDNISWNINQTSIQFENVSLYNKSDPTFELDGYIEGDITNNILEGDNSLYWVMPQGYGTTQNTQWNTTGVDIFIDYNETYYNTNYILEYINITEGFIGEGELIYFNDTRYAHDGYNYSYGTITDGVFNNYTSTWDLIIPEDYDSVYRVFASSNYDDDVVSQIYLYYNLTEYGMNLIYEALKLNLTLHWGMGTTQPEGVSIEIWNWSSNEWYILEEKDWDFILPNNYNYTWYIVNDLNGLVEKNNKTLLFKFDGGFNLITDNSSAVYIDYAVLQPFVNTSELNNDTLLRYCDGANLYIANGTRGSVNITFNETLYYYENFMSNITVKYNMDYITYVDNNIINDSFSDINISFSIYDYTNVEWDVIAYLNNITITNGTILIDRTNLSNYVRNRIGTEIKEMQFNISGYNINETIFYNITIDCLLININLFDNYTTLPDGSIDLRLNGTPLYNNYKGTYSFTYTKGGEIDEWDEYENGGDVRGVDNFKEHSKVVRLWDYWDDDYNSIMNFFNSTNSKNNGNMSSGIIEWWFAVEDSYSYTCREHTLELRYDDMICIKLLYDMVDGVDVINGYLLEDIISLTRGVWYHFKLEIFDNYTYNIWIDNDLKKSNVLFYQENNYSINNYYYRTVDLWDNDMVYLDAIDYSWSNVTDGFPEIYYEGRNYDKMSNYRFSGLSPDLDDILSNTLYYEITLGYVKRVVYNLENKIFVNWKENIELILSDELLYTYQHGVSSTNGTMNIILPTNTIIISNISEFYELENLYINDTLITTGFDDFTSFGLKTRNGTIIIHEALGYDNITDELIEGQNWSLYLELRYFYEAGNVTLNITYSWGNELIPVNKSLYEFSFDRFSNGTDILYIDIITSKDNFFYDLYINYTLWFYVEDIRENYMVEYMYIHKGSNLNISLFELSGINITEFKIYINYTRLYNYEYYLDIGTERLEVYKLENMIYEENITNFFIEMYSLEGEPLFFRRRTLNTTYNFYGVVYYRYEGNFNTSLETSSRSKWWINISNREVINLLINNEDYMYGISTSQEVMYFDYYVWDYYNTRVDFIATMLPFKEEHGIQLDINDKFELKVWLYSNDTELDNFAKNYYDNVYFEKDIRYFSLTYYEQEEYFLYWYNVTSSEYKDITGEIGLTVTWDWKLQMSIPRIYTNKTESQYLLVGQTPIVQEDITALVDLADYFKLRIKLKSNIEDFWRIINYSIILNNYLGNYYQINYSLWKYNGMTYTRVTNFKLTIELGNYYNFTFININLTDDYNNNWYILNGTTFPEERKYVEIIDVIQITDVVRKGEIVYYIGVLNYAEDGTFWKANISEKWTILFVRYEGVSIGFSRIVNEISWNIPVDIIENSTGELHFIYSPFISLYEEILDRPTVGIIETTIEVDRNVYGFLYEFIGRLGRYEYNPVTHYLNFSIYENINGTGYVDITSYINWSYNDRLYKIAINDYILLKGEIIIRVEVVAIQLEIISLWLKPILIFLIVAVVGFIAYLKRTTIINAIRNYREKAEGKSISQQIKLLVVGEKEEKEEKRKLEKVVAKEKGTVAFLKRSIGLSKEEEE